MGLTKTNVLITRDIVTGNQSATVNTSTILNAERRIVRDSRSTNMRPAELQQLNTKAEYLLYTEIGDPEIKINDKVTATLGGKVRKLIVKLIIPMTLVINSKTHEIYCSSNND